MYSTCIFCDRPLGRNEVIEAFPVGRRLAFDSSSGRLWAVCPTCRRWNLTPLEERWEALEECERVFRDLRTRVHSPEIGMAVHPEGLRLIRVGAPLPVEFALVRFGEAFNQRLRKFAFYTGLASAAGVTVVTMGAFSGFAAGFIGGQLPTVISAIQSLRSRVVLPLPGGEIVKVWPARVDLLNPEREGETGLRVKHKGGEAVLVGADARRAASKVLPAVNRQGALRKTVRTAVEQLQEAGGPEGLIQETWGKARPRPGAGIRWVMSNDMKAGNMSALPAATRLGLEMALQEEQERRAMEGELAALAAAWREAEAIAKISDDLLVPTKIAEKLEEMKQDVRILGPEDTP
jgi:hypothetical protein